MRRPIQIQLLVPMLSVVVLAIVLASAAGGYYSAKRQRQSRSVWTAPYPGAFGTGAFFTLSFLKPTH